MKHDILVTSCVPLVPTCVGALWFLPRFLRYVTSVRERRALVSSLSANAAKPGGLSLLLVVLLPSTASQELTTP